MTHSHNNEPITKFIDIFELMDCLRVSRTTIKRWNSNGAMPEGIRIGPRLVRWERARTISQSGFAATGAGFVNVRSVLAEVGAIRHRRTANLTDR